MTLFCCEVWWRGDGQSAVSLSVSVSLFWQENDADNPAKRLSASFFLCGTAPCDHTTSWHFALSKMASKLTGSKATTAAAKKSFPKGKGPSKF